MGNRTKTNRLVAAAATVALLATPAVASADDISAGCTDEVTGEAGLLRYDGECVTPAEYDAIFSFENLDSIQSLTDPTQSIAAEAGIVDDDAPASERPLGDGVTAEPFTFVGTLVYANGLPIRLA